MYVCTFLGVGGDAWLAPLHPPPLPATDLLEDPGQRCHSAQVQRQRL